MKITVVTISGGVDDDYPTGHPTMVYEGWLSLEQVRKLAEQHVEATPGLMRWAVAYNPQHDKFLVTFSEMPSIRPVHGPDKMKGEWHGEEFDYADHIGASSKVMFIIHTRTMEMV